MTIATAPVIRPTFDEMNLSTGKRTRLHRLMYEHGPANGTLMMLPIDQGLEHGPIDFFDNPDSIDTDWIYRLAVEGNFSGIALHIGLAEKYQQKYAGRVPLLLKVNGKTNVPPDDEAFSPMTSSVEDAVRLGADAVGYTLYVGSPAQDVDIAQCNDVRRECDRYGMPLVVWAYPRGVAVKAKGGIESLYAVDYAARVACEIGADIVKLNEPVWNADERRNCPNRTTRCEFTDVEGLRKRRKIGRAHARPRVRRKQDGRRCDHPQGARRHGSRLRRAHLRAQHVAAQMGRRALDGVEHARRHEVVRPGAISPRNRLRHRTIVDDE